MATFDSSGVGSDVSPSYSPQLTVENNIISITATDLESEVKTSCTPLKVESIGSTTAPARKLNDLCRLLPDGSEVSITLNNDKLSFHLVQR